MIVVKLTQAQRSALECACIDEYTPVLMRATAGKVTELWFLPEDAGTLADELTEAANSEDAQAERDGDQAARGACLALSNLASKVRSVGRDCPLAGG